MDARKTHFIRTQQSRNLAQTERYRASRSACCIVAVNSKSYIETALQTLQQ